MEKFSNAGELRRESQADTADSPLISYARERLRERGIDAYQLQVADVWCYVKPAPEPPSRMQGWKLHVSAAAPSAAEALRRVFDSLVDAGCSFKFAKSLDVVKLLNSTQYGRGGAGKFITVYPNDDEQFRTLAARLHEVTEGLVGQTILSDRPYKAGSLVSYRYGAFSGRARRGNDSDMRYFIVAPDGTEVEDRRDAWFNPPAWAECPLPVPESEGASPASVLLGGRYAAREAIRHANKGGVFVATDTETGAEVVVKQGRRHVGMTEDGWEVRDGIRNEAAMLDLLSPLGIAPANLALFEQQGDLFLVQQRIEGKPLRHHVLDMEMDADRTAPTWNAVATLGRKLVDLLATVHGKGIVLRDFSPNNVMVRPDGEIVIVDLEFAVPAGTTTFPIGTPGYCDPTRSREDHLVAAADDLYSLGALLYLLATGTDPVFAADEPADRTVQQRIAEGLATAGTQSEAARRVSPLVLGLLDADAARRWSLPAAAAFLAAPRKLRPPAVTPPPDRDRLIADGLGWLAEVMTPASTERLWPTTCFGQETDPCNVQHGAAGVAATLLQALRLGHGEGLATPLRQACDWLVDRTGPDTDPLPGLYFGRAGVAWLLHDAGRWFDDPGLVAHGLALAERLALVWPNPDVTHGSAGSGLLQLHLWQATGEPRFADRFGACADGIAAQVVRRDGRAQWRVPPDFDSAFAGKAFYGFAHGSAGIGWFLLAAGIAADRPDWHDLATDVGEDLYGAAVRYGGGALWHTGPDADQTAPAEVWCNGSSGVGTFLIRLWRATGDDRFLEVAREAAFAVWSRRRHASPSNCHGLAGNGDFLLDMFDATGEARYRTWAADLADAIAVQYMRRGRWYVVPNESRVDLTADYGVGLAGTLAYLMRLTHGTPRMWMADPASVTEPGLVSAR